VRDTTKFFSIFVYFGVVAFQIWVAERLLITLFNRQSVRLPLPAKAPNPNAPIITRAGQARYAQAVRNSGADQVIIPEYEGGLMTGRMISKDHPVLTNLE
jgi:hypothetical protein